MKTRSNMPLYVLEVSNVKTLSNAQIDLLRCGDYLVKKDASGEHAYKVTFKSDTGLCLTYHDASVIETQSYDKIDGVWTYNSEDKTPNLLEISGGTKLYKHNLVLSVNFEVGGSSYNVIRLDFISTKSDAITGISQISNNLIAFTGGSIGSSYIVINPLKVTNPGGLKVTFVALGNLGTVETNTISSFTSYNTITYDDTITEL